MNTKAVTKRELINQIEQLQEVTRITLNESHRRGQRDYQPNGEDGMSLPVAHLEDIIRESEDILNRIRVERECDPHTNIPTIDAKGIYYLDISQSIAQGVKFLIEKLPRLVSVVESYHPSNSYYKIVSWTGDSKAPTITTLMDGMSLNRARMVVKLYESSEEFQAMKNPSIDFEILEALEDAQLQLDIMGVARQRYVQKKVTEAINKLKSKK